MRSRVSPHSLPLPPPLASIEEESFSTSPLPSFDRECARSPTLFSNDSKESIEERKASELVQPPLLVALRSGSLALADAAPSAAAPLVTAPTSAGPLASFATCTSLVPRIISYNVNGLSYYASAPDSVSRKNLIAHAVSDFVLKSDILCLQETNLTADDCFCFSSLGGCLVSRNSFKAGVAGTLIVDTPAILRFYKPVDVPLPDCCRGYVQCRRYVPINTSLKEFQLFNCYFFTGADKFAIQAKLVESMASVSNRCPTYFCGDFNFVESAADSSSANPGFPPGEFLVNFALLKAHFDVGEVPHSEHTFFRYTADVSSAYSYSARLDRFFIPLSHLHALVFDPSLSILPHSSNFRPRSSGPRTSFSDHLPVFLNYVTDVCDSGNKPSIPLWLAQSPEFAAALGTVWRPPLVCKCPFVTLGKLKAALFKAAACARKTKIEVASAPLKLSQHICLLRLVSSRPQDSARISRLLVLAPSLSRTVSLVGGRFLDCGLEAAARNLLVEASGAVSARPVQHPTKALKDKLPSSKARIAHLRASLDDTPAFDIKGKSAVAKDFWSRIWAPRLTPPSNVQRAHFLACYTKRVDSSLLDPPSLDAVLEAIKGSNNSSPGPDGIPFAAWRAAAGFAGPVLFEVLKLLCKGQEPPPGFNHGLLFLIPKKHTGLISDTRPISVTNTDNRLLASTVAQLIMPAVSSLVEVSQKGFLAGQNGMDHTLQINEFFFEGVKLNAQRLGFFLDTAKAFDSIDHQWVLHVLAVAGFPPWLLSFVEGSLSHVKVAPCFGRSLTDWIDIERGVKQGCPLSPLLFIIAYDPLLFALSSLSNISIHAFADDLALTGLCVSDISPALNVITIFSRLSGLGINRDKSCVISSGPPSSLPALRTELARSPWPDLPLRDSTTHLGIVIGREVTLGDIFASPFKKAVDRINNCRSVVKGLSVPNRILFINTFVISLFSYHALFFVIPSEHYQTIKGMICKIVTPFNGGAYTYETLVCLNTLFSIRPSLKDLWAFNVSLLASRSSLISTTCNYNDIPFMNIVFSKFIREHRDTAAYDFWRGRHLEDGTLTPLLKCTSPVIYQALVEDNFLPTAEAHCGKKVSGFLSSNFPSLTLPVSCLSSISKSLSLAARNTPSYFLFLHFSLINNALSTSRRMRHQNNLSRSLVEKCFYCFSCEDSIVHLFSFCLVIHKAREIFFRQHSACSDLLSLFPAYFAPAPSCLPFPLAFSFLVDVPPKLTHLFIVFNYAVWNFRHPAASSRLEHDDLWRTNRVAELASTFLLRIKPVLTKKGAFNDIDDSVISHDSIIDSAPTGSLICYTDGSASPNPGPSGAGASVFDVIAGAVFDLGLSLGHGTNNLGELIAVGICLKFIGDRCASADPRPPHVYIFTDSLFASNAVVSSKKPASHAVLIKLIRALFAMVVKLVPTTFHWIRGHSGVGGNERVDRIAKLYAPLSAGVLSTPFSFDTTVFKTDWHTELISSPFHLFLERLPNPVAATPTSHTLGTDTVVRRPNTLDSISPVPVADISSLSASFASTKRSQRTATASSHRMRLRTERRRLSGGYISSGYCRDLTGPEVGFCSLEPVESEAVSRPTTVCVPWGSIDTVGSDSDHLDHKHDS